MPDILIRGMEMPERSDIIVQIFSDGKAVLYPFLGEPRKIEVVELPPHGDLIDRNALEDTGADVYVVYDDNGVDESYAFSHDAILNAPVIVPASEGGNK